MAFEGGHGGGVQPASTVTVHPMTATLTR